MTEIKNKLNQTSNLNIKVIQFGEGNFLRAFFGYALDVLNKQNHYQGGIGLIQPIKNGMIEELKKQGGAYTLFLNGLQKNKIYQKSYLINNIVQMINPYNDFDSYLSLSKIKSLQLIVSNTTESGIAFCKTDHFDDKPPSSYPAKLTRFLWERFDYFNGSEKVGLHILPCELINHNADILKQCILKYIDLWNLNIDFKLWVENSLYFHNTLVDRIVPGYPTGNVIYYADKLTYIDDLMVVAEPFFLWIIEGNDKLKSILSISTKDLDLKIVKDLQPYRTRKVLILNGAHTAIVPLSILYGNETVLQTMENSFTSDFITNTIYEEIIPNIKMNKKELIEFAENVFDRFKNPFIKHYLNSIALNSISKFKVRVLPSIVKYYSVNNRYPKRLSFSMACLIVFYRGKWEDRNLNIQDDPEILLFFKNAWKIKNIHELSKTILGNQSLWGEKLTENNEFVQLIEQAIVLILDYGVEKGFNKFNSL